MEAWGGRGGAAVRRYPGTVEAMWELLPKVCPSCGMRFGETADGHAAFGLHMDWHFRRNRREREKARRAVPREWFLPANVRARAARLCVPVHAACCEIVTCGRAGPHGLCVVWRFGGGGGDWGA